jgi:hypothetical protein
VKGSDPFGGGGVPVVPVLAPTVEQEDQADQAEPAPVLLDLDLPSEKTYQHQPAKVIKPPIDYWQGGKAAAEPAPESGGGGFPWWAWAGVGVGLWLLTRRR